MTRSHDALLPASADRRPSMLAFGVGVVVVALAVYFVIGVVVPTVFSLVALAIPVALLVVGGRMVAESRRAGGTSLAKVTGWALVAVGAVWLLNRLNVFDLATFLLIRLPITILVIVGVFYVARRLFAPRR